MEQVRIFGNDFFVEPLRKRVYLLPGEYMDFPNDKRVDIRPWLLVEGRVYTHAMQNSTTTSPEDRKYFHVFEFENKRMYNVRVSDDTYLTVPSESIIWKDICSYCYDVKSTLWTCSKCLIRKYCSKTCQLNHRPLHKHECKMFHKHRNQIVRFKNSEWAHKDWVTMEFPV